VRCRRVPEESNTSGIELVARTLEHADAFRQAADRLPAA
jgi:hypothetical protein